MRTTTGRVNALLITIAASLNALANTIAAGPINAPIDLILYSDVYYVSRATGSDIVAENEGGMYLQRSEISTTNNMVWQDYRFIEYTERLRPSRFEGNILKGPVDVFEAPVTFKRNMGDPLFAVQDATPVTNVFEEDDIESEIVDMNFDPTSNATTITTEKMLPSNTQFQDFLENSQSNRAISRSELRNVALL